MRISSAALQQNDCLSWCGLAPGLSDVGALLEKFGTPDGIENLTNGKIYYFANGMIQATVLKDSTRIRRLLIARQMLGAPATISDFERRFGPIVEKEHDKLQGVIYERQGIRVIVNAYGQPAQIRWIELF